MVAIRFEYSISVTVIFPYWTREAFKSLQYREWSSEKNQEPGSVKVQLQEENSQHNLGVVCV